MEGRPDIRGVDGKNVFFFNHNFPEETNPSLQSKQNSQEAMFLLYFARYLTQQKYAGAQITVLSLYTGQLLLMKQKLRNEFAHY